jgi:hypothetical protein
VSLCTTCRVSLPCLCEQPAPSPQPEMPEGWSFSPAHGGLFHGHDMVITMQHIRTLLATQGLAVVSAEQKAVLDAAEGVTDPYLRNIVRTSAWQWCRDVANAVLARRGSL